VALLTRGKVVTSERTLPVVTCHATLDAASGVMVQRLRCSYLTALWLAGANPVTFVASHLRVVDVTKADAERRHYYRCARVTTRLMTCAARGNVAPAGLRALCVAAKTGCMRAEIRRYRHRRAAPSLTMTARAT